MTIDQELKPTRIIRWPQLIGGEVDGKPFSPDWFDKGEEGNHLYVNTTQMHWSPGQSPPPIQQQKYEMHKYTVGDSKLFVVAFVAADFEGDALVLVWERLLEQVCPTGGVII